MNKIKYINLALTNRCNLNCIMCDIWKEKDKIDFSLDLVDKLFINGVLDDNVNLSLTGGEPFLYPYLNEITEKIIDLSSEAMKTITTNGTMIDEIALFLDNFMDSLPKDFKLNISFDGLDSQTKVRGKGSSNVLDNILKIRKRFPDLNLAIKYTITPFNLDDIIKTYNFFKKINVGFKLKLMESAENYTNRVGLDLPSFSQDDKKKIILAIKKIIDDNPSSSDVEFLKLTAQSLVKKLDRKKCCVLKERIFVMEDGEVYSCVHMGKLGNLGFSNLDDIWNGSKHKDLHLKFKEIGCSGCVAYHGF